MQMSRDVAIAIGVADATPLPYLSGAVNGARAFHEWASQVGYDSRLLTDEDAPVTLLRLRQELELVLEPADGTIHRMVLYFAGHGLIREAEEGLWLLSDWDSEQRAVAVEVLKRRLYMHDIQQIAIFADCCRSLPRDILAADLTPDGVLGRGPNQPDKIPPIDKFIATQDGTTAFMVPGASPEADRCLFSGVLMEGLWAIKPEALSKVVKDKVTSRSLGKYLEGEVPKRAESYSRKLVPNVSPTFPEGDDIYFYPGSGDAPKPPPLPEWPAPANVVPMEIEEPERTRRSGEAAASRGSDEAKRGLSSRSERLIKKIQEQQRPQHFETGAGFAVDGGLVKCVWTTPDVIAEPHGKPNWWRLRHQNNSILATSAPVLIEFNDGVFAAVAAMPSFITTVLRDGPGISALIYRKVDQPVETAAVAEKAIAKMESGALRAADATNLAVKLRLEKHNDPVLGVISAYLYDSIGDIDSIRRMAFYYTLYGQPIPYDIALLAQLRGKRRNNVIRTKVPAVRERKARTEGEQKYDWTRSATNAQDGEVGGSWPWMKQGWAFLDDEPDLVALGLTKISRHLVPGRFTTLNKKGAMLLAAIFNLISHG
jgi:hypothetical protein